SDLLTWQWAAGGGAQLALGEWTTYPAAYADAYRIRVKSLQVNRSDNFQEQQAVLQIVLEPEHDRSLKPLRDAQLKIEEVVDDQGQKLDAADPMKRQLLVRLRMPDPLIREFEFTNLSPKATRLASLRVTATYTFPTETQEVILDNPVRGATQELGRYKV